jgi:ribonuclease P protein subunit RPR2
MGFWHTAPFLSGTIILLATGCRRQALKERSKNPSTKKIALERIAILFEQAGAAFHQSPSQSNRYVELARRIAMRQRVRIDHELRRQYCHHCYAFLVPGKNMRVRVHRGHVSVTCSACKKTTRYRVEKHHDKEN